MKQLLKFSLVVCLFPTLFIACSSSKDGTAARKEVKGAWTLSSVTFSGITNPDQVKIQLFDDANLDCFAGSTWELPNNGYGSYTITKTNGGCTPGTRNIIWSYRNENGETIFQFKKLQEGIKAKKIEDGYKLKIVSATDEKLLMQSMMSFEGKNLTLDYNFVRKL